MHRQILYLSHITPQANYRHLADITQQSAALNRRDGIRAALLFDGYRFCQRADGPADAVEALLARLVKDSRHADLRVLFDQRLAAVDRPPTAIGVPPWLSGYCEATAFDVFDAPTPLQGQAALDRFDLILLAADLRP